VTLLTEEQIAKLSPEAQQEYRDTLALIVEQLELNPLERFHACRKHCGISGCIQHPRQADFLEARTPIQAVFAGNRFGKTLTLVIKSVIQCVDEDWVPERLKSARLVDGPAKGRIVGPGQAHSIFANLVPTFRQWTPEHQLLGRSFDRAWDKQHRILRFQNGSEIDFLTYEMDLDKFGGVSRNFVGYDEPPPRDIRNECRMRLIDTGGFELFAMTPLQGAGWIKQAIWKQREHPDVTVVRGSIHDNPVLSSEEVEKALRDLSYEERRAREFGEFLNLGGVVYPGGFESALIPRPEPRSLEGMDVVVGIDPGIVNAALVWVAFDSDNVAIVFDELLLKDKTAVQYAEEAQAINAHWRCDPLYVIDPSAVNRSHTSGENVQMELARHGMHAVKGNNAVDAGVFQIQRRLQQRGLFVSEHCAGLRDEADDYTREEYPPDSGEYRIVKANDHRLDALRYAVISRPWYADSVDDAPLGRRDLEIAPGHEWFEPRERGPVLV
jgi:hypothetical protein